MSLVEQLVVLQKKKKSQKKTEKPEKKLNFFKKKNSCPVILAKTLKQATSDIKIKPESAKKGSKPRKKSLKNPIFNHSSCNFQVQQPQEKPNKTFDFPSKDEEILYNIINQEYQTMFNISSTKSMKARKTTLPNIEEYLERAKDYSDNQLMKKKQIIKSKCNEISKKFEHNLMTLKINYEQKRKIEEEEIIEKACKKIQSSWRNYQKQKVTLKNVMNICQTTLYQKNRAKILQKRDNNSLKFKKKAPEKKPNRLLKKKEDFCKKKPFLKNLKIDTIKLLHFSNNNFKNGNIDSFSSSKQKHSINTTLNFKEINENSKSLITIHDFNSKSIEREDLSKLTSSIHENLNKNFIKNEDLMKDSSQERSKKEGKYDKINEENSESFSEKEGICKKPQTLELGSPEVRKRNISEKIVSLIELSSKYQQELDFIKEEYLSKLNNKDVNNSTEKFFSLMKKQCDLNKKILLENFKLNKAISEQNPESPFNIPLINSESNPNELKISMKSNLSDLRAAFGSEKLLQEASNSIGREKEKENQRIFEEDSFRKFTNKKILEFLKKDNSLKEILKIRDTNNNNKKKSKSCELQNKREKKGFEIEKWVSNEKKEKDKLKKQNKRRNFLGIDLPKVFI